MAGYTKFVFSQQTDDFFDRPVASRTGAVPTLLALLPGLLLILWALLRAV
ncbi:hypothetical protein BH23ACT4_BH23ACT4_01650 [soil metagenome]